MNTKKVINLYLENKISEANELLESLLIEKINIALEKRKSEIFILPEGKIKVDNKKKKNRLQVRAGRAVGGISAKHTGRNLFRTMQPNQLKSILATEQYRPAGFHSSSSNRLKHHLRIVHPIKKQKRNRIQYKNLQNRLDRK